MTFGGRAGLFNVAAAEPSPSLTFFIFSGTARIESHAARVAGRRVPDSSEADTLIRRARAPATMLPYVSVVGIVAITMTVLMVVSMLYLVWGALDGDAHTPSPDADEQPELGDGDEAADSDEPQAELTADGNSA
jgi:hypothetical protein